MFLTNQAPVDGKSTPTALRGHEHGDLPIDDPPPAEHPSEQYVSWRATAIFNLTPFTSRPF
jgi:hypothetical protein